MELTAERSELDLPAGAAAGILDLANWLEARAADFALRATVTGVNPTDPRYRRPWGLDTDAIRADLRAAGATPCNYWDCVEVAIAAVRWRRTWSSGSFGSTSRYCARHLAELRAGARWAIDDPRLAYVDKDSAPGGGPQDDPPGGQMPLPAVAALAELAP